MFLRKIIHHKRSKQLGEYFIWLAFISMMLVFTNLAASLVKIHFYNFNLLSVSMTYGFILFCSFVEALICAGLFVAVDMIAQKLFKIELAIVFRFIMLLVLILTLLIMVVFIFLL